MWTATESTPGNIDYTPELTINISGKYGDVYENSESPILTANADVLNPEEGVLSYQWYYVVLPDRVYVPDYISFDKYVKVDCEEKSYKVPTDSTFIIVFSIFIPLILRSSLTNYCF